MLIQLIKRTAVYVHVLVADLEFVINRSLSPVKFAHEVFDIDLAVKMQPTALSTSFFVLSSTVA